MAFETLSVLQTTISTPLPTVSELQLQLVHYRLTLNTTAVMSSVCPGYVLIPLILLQTACAGVQTSSRAI